MRDRVTGLLAGPLDCKYNFDSSHDGTTGLLAGPLDCKYNFDFSHDGTIGLLAGPLDCIYNFDFLFVGQQLKGEYNPDELLSASTRAAFTFAH
jgi:hypothetical protein